MKIHLLAACSLLGAHVHFAGVPAFPGAEGFGANAKGGRGGRVIEVTSLDDSGPGTLRAACEAEGARTVVFRVGGTIAVQSPIMIRSPFLTIAGQTAPGDGILIRKGNSKVTPIDISTHDVVIRCIRIRSGDSPDGSQTDCLDIHNTVKGDYVGDIILDHCSFSWSTDENLAIMGRYVGGHAVPPGSPATTRPDMLAINWDKDTATTNITVQWCINSEGLYTPHIKKSRGALLKFVRNLSYHHNLTSHHSAPRNPRLQGHEGTIKDVVNNIIFNTRRYGSMPGDGVRFNFVGNYYKAGPETGTENHAVGAYNEPVPFNVYLKGNYHSTRRTSDTQDEHLVMESRYQSQMVPQPFAAPAVRTTSAAQAYDDVLRYAGCIVPRRDSVDERIISDVRNGTGKIKTSVADAGGYPTIAGGTPPLDTDHDGMPDAWETRHGLDPRNPDDRNGDLDNDGYTNLEEYLNSLIPIPS